MAATEAPFQRMLKRIRNAFPQPTSDPQHDAYFVFSILRALDRVDTMKSEIPILGKPRELDFAPLRQSRIDEAPRTLEEVSQILTSMLEGMPIWSHPLSQINVVPPTSIASIIGALLPKLYNPNMISDDMSYGVAEAEVATAAMLADLVGYDPEQSTGFFTFGGTATNLYGAKIGLEKAFPGSMENGVTPGQGVILASEQSHYCRLTVAGWLGLGEKAAIAIPTNWENDINVAELERTARELLQQGKRIIAIIATLGTTDALGIDDLEAIVQMRDRLVEEFQLNYKPHVHADAVIGWAWSVFNDYDFEENPLGFRPRTIRSLAGVCRRVSKLHLADSFGVDFHKTGFAPYISSLFLVRNHEDLKLLLRDRAKMPYLFQTGSRHPGMFTLETSREGSGAMSAFANLRLLGKTGLRCLLGHVVEMAELLREHLEGHKTTTVLNEENLGSVTLFRVYPPGVDTWGIVKKELQDPAFRSALLAHNEYNRKIFQHMHKLAMEGKGVRISMSECYRNTTYGEPVVALKSYILSPFVEESHVEFLMKNILDAQKAIR